MNSRSPKFSVIMASYNRAATLPRAIESFQAQTYRAKELIVIDGGSTDDTKEILSSYSNCIHYLVSEPDNGILDAWNKGLKHITGDWIFFQGADDLYYDENVFANMAEHLIAHEVESKIIYGILELVNLRGEFIEWMGEPWNATRFREFGMCIPHTSTFHHRSLFEEYGEFDTDSLCDTPYELFLRYLKDHDAVFVPIVVASMIIGGESTRPENLLTFVREDRRAQNKHGTLKWNFMIIPRSVIYIKAFLKFILSKIFPDTFYWDMLDFIRMVKGRRRMHSWRRLE